MSNQPQIMVRLSGEPSLIEELERVVQENTDDMKLQSVGPSTDTARLRLGLAEVATMVTLVNGLVTLSKFAYTLYKHFSEKQASVVTIQTPLRTVEIRSTDALSEEGIAEQLRSALRP